MPKSIKPKKPADHQIYGVIAGTIIAALTGSLPDKSAVKSILMYLTPVFTAILIWCSKKVSMYFQNEELKSLTLQYKSEIQAILQDSTLTVKQRKGWEAKIKDIDTLKIESIHDRIKRISNSLNDLRS